MRFLHRLIFIASLIALSSEILSLFQALNRLTVALFWAALLAGLFLWRGGGLYRGVRRRSVMQSPSESAPSPLCFGQRTSLFFAMGRVGVGLLLSVVFYVLILLLIALLSPPNTNDSLQYHLSRVAHWAQQGSLDYYPTPIDRQLWMPPWAELAVLQLYLLAGGDWLANTVQWACMLSSLVIGAFLARQLGASRAGQIFTIVCIVTLPMGILQATSTQTDYATALWLLILACFAVIAHQRCLSRLEWLSLSVAVGLGALTKGSYYPFALPLLAWLLISTLRQNASAALQTTTSVPPFISRQRWSLPHSLLPTLSAASFGFLIVLILNLGVWTRNFRAYGSPLGPFNSIANEKFGPSVLVSNLLRNSTLHLATPYGVINGPIRQLVEGTLWLIGEDANDPLTTLDGNTYRVRHSNHEDYAGNPLHFLFIPVSFVILLRSRRRTEQWSAAVILGIALLCGFVLFSALYKWQTTGSRLQLPFFVAWMPLAGLALEQLASYKRHPDAVVSTASHSPLPTSHFPLPTFLSALLLIAGLFPLLANPSRSLYPTGPASLIDFTPAISLRPRQDVLFVNIPEYQRGYTSVIEALKTLSGCQSIGLKIDSHDPEYPFWALLSPAAAAYPAARIEHIDLGSGLVSRSDESAGDDRAPFARLDRGDDLDRFEPCAIICTYCTDSILYGLPLHSVHFGGYTLYANP